METHLFKMLGPVDEKNLDAQVQRAMIMTRDFPVERRFGYFRIPSKPHLPIAISNSATEETEEEVKLLKEIETLAGTLTVSNSTTCGICFAERRKPSYISQFDRVFRPLPVKIIYRWPASLMHYLDLHQIESPMWMSELIADYKEAKGKGFWSHLSDIHGSIRQVA